MVSGIEFLRVDYCVKERLRKLVHSPGFRIGIAQLELLLGEFTIDIQYRFGSSDLVSYLDGEDGLPDVGISKEAGDFPLILGVSLGFGPSEHMVGNLTAPEWP